MRAAAGAGMCAGTEITCPFCRVCVVPEDLSFQKNRHHVSLSPKGPLRWVCPVVAFVAWTVAIDMCLPPGGGRGTAPAFTDPAHWSIRAGSADWNGRRGLQRSATRPPTAREDHDQPSAQGNAFPSQTLFEPRARLHHGSVTTTRVGSSSSPGRGLGVLAPGVTNSNPR